MTININIENAAAETAQSCSKDSTVAGDVLMLYTKIAITLALILCALLASGFVAVLRAVRAVHADLATVMSVGVYAQIPAILESGPESVPLNTDAVSGLEVETTTESNSSEEGKMLGAWWEMGNITLAWIGRSVSATTMKATGMINPGGTASSEAEFELPSPALMTG